MAYLGTKPQSGFISQEANQYFTGLTQNYIDLNQSISSLSSVIVLVNGVVQENSTMSLTSSTRITLGDTLVSADKVTCIYVAKISSTQAPAVGTVTNDMLSGSIDLTSKVTGVLPIANGGTNVSSGFSYSIGTFTPTMSGITLNFTTGNYVKIGSAVSIQGYIDMGTQSGGTTCVISGLPFTSANYTQYLDATGDYASGTSQALRIPASASTMSLINKTNHADNNTSDFNYNDMNGKYFYFHGVYYV